MLLVCENQTKCSQKHNYTRGAFLYTLVFCSCQIAQLIWTLTDGRGGPSADLGTPETGAFGTLLGATYSCADILQKEDSRYQETPLKACSISSFVPNTVVIPANTTVTQTFITAYGFDLNGIEADFNKGIYTQACEV